MGFESIQEIPEESKTVMQEVKVVRDANGAIDLVPVDRSIDMDKDISGSDHFDNMDEAAKKYENDAPELTMVPIPESVEVPPSRTVDDREVDNVPEQSR